MDLRSCTTRNSTIVYRHCVYHATCQLQLHAARYASRMHFKTVLSVGHASSPSDTNYPQAAPSLPGHSSLPGCFLSPQALEAQALEMGLADLARQALSADPEAAAQLKRYEAAVVRLEKAKAAEKELEAIMKVSAFACIAIRSFVQ